MWQSNNRSQPQMQQQQQYRYVEHVETVMVPMVIEREIPIYGPSQPGATRRLSQEMAPAEVVHDIQTVTKEVYVPVPKLQAPSQYLFASQPSHYQSKFPISVPKEMTKGCHAQVEKIVDHYVEVPVERIVDREVPVDRIVEKPVYIEVPVERWDPLRVVLRIFYAIHAYLGCAAVRWVTHEVPTEVEKIVTQEVPVEREKIVYREVRRTRHPSPAHCMHRGNVRDVTMCKLTRKYLWIFGHRDAFPWNGAIFTLVFCTGSSG